MPFGEAFKGDRFQDDFPALHGCSRASAMFLGI
jgi:hypothetical protein